MSLQIIKAGVSHAAVIASIGKKSFRKSFEHQFRSREELFEYLEHTYDPVKLAKSLRKENNHYFLALLHNEAVGFAKVKLHSLNEQLESIAQMELQKIYVLPERHENGAGSALLHAVKQLAEETGPDYIWLDTHIDNEKAIRLYEKNGFTKMERYFFIIGTQVFEYHLMAMPVAIAIRTTC